MQKLAIVGVLVFTLLVGVAIGWQVRESRPVCHTVGNQEDSTWTDCDFRDGAVWVK